MSNSLGTLSGALIAQEGLPLLLAQYPLIKNIVTDFSDEPVLFNQSVITRIPTVGSATDYSTTNGYVASNATSTDVTVTVNKHKYFGFTLTDQDISGTKRNLVEEYSKSFAAKVGLQIMADLTALWTEGNFTNTPITQAVSGATIDTIYTAANTALNTVNVSSDRFAVLNPALAGAIRTDAKVVYLTAGGQGIAGAQLPVIQGVTTTEFSALPANSINLIGAVGAKDAMVFASRVPQDPGAMADVPVNGKLTVVTDPDSGLSVQVREYYDVQKGFLEIGYALMYGVAVGNPVSLELIVSA